MEVGTGPGTFTAHGLVEKWQLELPYREAKRNVDPRTGHASKEHYTVSYFEDLFAKVIFSHDDFSINQQISGVPKPGAEKACDIVIKYFSPAQGRQLLCFAECKRRRNTSPSRLVDLEEQARGYCIDFLDDNPQIPRAFACTLVGVWICPWYMSRERNVLVPLLPGGTSKQGDFGNYKDTGLDENAELIMASFQDMIKASQHGLAFKLPAYVGPTD
jgi:hypothetical protein